MAIYGFQKLTLLDYPGRTAATMFTGGCDYRCPFCQNGMLVLEPESQRRYSFDKICAYLELRSGLLEGVCISGGEPTLDPALPDYCRRLHEIGYAVKLDTNGTRPEVVRSLLDDGLIDMVAMDIKTSPARYAAVTGTEDGRVAQVKETAALLMEGRIPFEFRTTVVRELHCAEDFRAIGEWLAGAPAYFLQAFRMSDGVINPGLHACTVEEMTAFRDILRERIPGAELRGL